MHRALIRFLLLLAMTIGAAHAQPPAPVGGDMSNTTTKATGASAARKLADRAADILNPFDFGAIGDGATHPLSTRYGSLAAAQAVCPEATALTQEIDWCAMQAAIDRIATKPAIAGISGTPGGTIRIPASTTLKLGATPLVANTMSLGIVGDDQWSSTLLIGANPALQFGLSNSMGIGSATVAVTGSNFVVGETLTLSGLGGTCTTNPVITITAVGGSGEIQGETITTPGNCSPSPTNPLDYTSSGNGYGANFNGTFTAGALTSVVLASSTGSGCVNGETLTGPGGTMPNGKPVVPFQLTVNSAIAGAVQKGGVSIANPGAYGTPPANPVTTTGSGGCTGATFNIGAFTNSGGALTMERLQMFADGAGVSVAKAQFNLTSRTTLLNDLILYAFGTNYFSGGWDMMSMSNAEISHIDTHNNLTYLNSNPSNALFVVHQQNNLLGHFEAYWDHVNTYAFMGGVVDYIAVPSDTVPFQGLKFHRLVCGLGAHCLRLENTSPQGYGNILIDDFYAGQTTQQIEITKGISVQIVNSGFLSGQTRLTTPPAQADFVTLNNVNQWILRGNTCGSALIVTPSQTCFHIKGTSSFGVASGNIITNAAKAPTFNGYVFDAQTTGNLQIDDYFGGFLTPVVDAGNNNVSVVSPAQVPCLSHTFVNGETFTIPDGTACLYINGGFLPAITIVLPANAITNQVMQFTSFSTITALTIQANTSVQGQTLGAGIPSTIAAGTPFALKYITFRWQMI